MKISYYIICFFILFIIMNMLSQTCEPFTPQMREYYRPYLRRTKNVSESLYTDIQNRANILFRRYRIL